MAMETASNTLSMDVKVVDGMVPKAEFDRAIEAAQQALRAKTASSQQMLAQASSAMRNALTALSLSEQEVANLKATVKELQERPAEGTNEIIEREREELRMAQQRVADLSAAFRQLQGEVARVRYEQEGFDMPVAMSLPMKIAPELSSRVTVIAQLVMLGYSYEDGEMALDAIRVNDLHLALEWLEGRHATKTQFSINQRRAALMDDEVKSRRITTTNEVRTVDQTRSIAPLRPLAEKVTRASPMQHGETVKEEVRVIARRGATQSSRRSSRPQLSLYEARKRAVSSMICISIKPPGASMGMTKEQSEAIAERCIAGLARLAHRSSAYMILSLGGNRCAFDCLKLYEKNPAIVRSCFKLIRALAINPSTMMHLKRQQRFRLLPNTVTQCASLHSGLIDVVSEAAHTLWAANMLGGKITQERVKASGILRVIKLWLEDPDIKRKDSDGAFRRKMIGLLLSLANDNKTVQKFLVDEGYRAMLCKTLQDAPALTYDGEFASLSGWIKEENDSPSYAPDQQKPKDLARGARSGEAANTSERDKKIIEDQKYAATMRANARSHGTTNEQRYFAKKRVVVMLCKIALNPPGSIEGISKIENEEIAYRALLALARIAEKGSAYLVLISGGPRTAVDCLRYYVYNADMMYACCRILRALLSSPTTMIKLLKQVRFKILPSAIIDAVARHEDDLEMKAEAAHALWAYTGVGGASAQQTVMDCGPIAIDFLKDGLAEARADTGSNQYVSTIRKFIGCILSLAKDNKAIQDKLVEAGLRGAVRKALSENQTISFHGEFSTLRDWIRGDRGGAKSTSRSSAGVSRTERNAAEKALEKGTEDEARLPVRHLDAQQLQARSMDGTPSRSETPTRKMTYAESVSIEGKSALDTRGRNPSNQLSSKVEKRSMIVPGMSAFDTQSDVSTSDNTAQAAPRLSALEKNLSSVHRKGVPMKAQKPESSIHEWNINQCIAVLSARNRSKHGEASEALAEQVTDEPTCGIAFVLNGGMPALENALILGDAAFAAGVCSLIHLLCSSTLTLKRCQADKVVLQGSLFSAIINAMAINPNDSVLQQWGATAMWALLKDNPRAKSCFMLVRSSEGQSSLRVLKNALVSGMDTEATVRAVVGCLLSLAVNSVSSQRMLSDLAMPHVILAALGKHPSISYRGQFDSLREWLRDNAAREHEVVDDARFK